MSESSNHPQWSVTMRNHLYRNDGDEGPAYFHRTFPGATAAEAHAAAVAYGLDAGDCSPVEDVAEVEGPLSAPSGEAVSL